MGGKCYLIIKSMASDCAGSCNVMGGNCYLVMEHTSKTVSNLRWSIAIVGVFWGPDPAHGDLIPILKKGGKDAFAAADLRQLQGSNLLGQVPCHVILFYFIS
jgi:hypothetical protein